MPDAITPNNKQFKDPSDDQETVSFAVMPHDKKLQQGGPVKMSDINAASERSEHPSIWHQKSTYIVIGALVVLILGALAYFLLWPTDNNSDDNQQNAAHLPKVFLKQYFNTEDCQNQTLCGDNSDPDGDGLGNYDEFRAQTDPTKADSDEDGLADGDEINVYLTEPTLKFTDKRPIAEEGGYTDGSQIKNGYDPLTPGLKMTDSRNAQIETATQEHGLHEPTKKTMTEASPTQTKSVSVFIENGKFNPAEVELNVNDTVIWLNKDVTAHQIVTSTQAGETPLADLASGSLATNQTYSFKFVTAGTYNYHDGMNATALGKIIVK